MVFHNKSHLVPCTTVKPTKSMTRPVLTQSIFFFVLHDVYCRLVRLRSARESVPLVRAVPGRYPWRPRRHLFTGFDTRLLIAQLVLLGTPVAILSFLRRRRVVAVPRPLSNASAALGRAFAPRAPSAPAGLLHGGRRDCKNNRTIIDTVRCARTTVSSNAITRRSVPGQGGFE